MHTNSFNFVILKYFISITHSQAPPPVQCMHMTFDPTRMGSKVICVLVARNEGEPGAEANPRSGDRPLWCVCQPTN